MFDKSHGMAALTENAKAARAKYAREWRKKNPDKVRATNARYWNKKAQNGPETTQNEEETE